MEFTLLNNTDRRVIEKRIRHDMEKLKMQTLSGTEENIRRIAELFPSCVTEVRRNGKTEQAIDFDVLRQELQDSLVKDGEERYQFTWPDKSKSKLLANSKIRATLRPCREESVDFDTTRNLYIEGDNLDVLKCLKETYSGQVKMIYIDPPYNTGNDFVYEDDFSESAADYLARSGQYDDQGNRLVTNKESNGRFHTDWLNMIYPRLIVARDLLTDDGVIFISIDDNEVENLRKVCDEVFGECNFVYELSVVNNLNGNDNSSGMMETQEYCFIYAKNKSRFTMGVLPLEEEEANDWYQDELGFWKVGRCLKATGINAPREARPNLFFPIFINEKTLEFTVIEEEAGADWYHLIPLTEGREMSWYWSKETFIRDKNEVIVRKTPEGYSLYKKQRPALGDLPSKRGKTTFYSPKYANANSNAEIKQLFDGKKIFDYTKSTQLLKDLISLGTTNNDSLILDFFSGSATTAHAVMQLNAEDGGNRRFIMVQLPELTDEKSEAYKAGYRNICEIGKERIRRAGAKIKADHPLTTQDLDTGFRVLKLAESNMLDVYYTPAELRQDDLFSLADNIRPDRTPLDLLFQVMLDLGAPLDSKIEVLHNADLGLPDSPKPYTVFRVADNYLLACFDTDVTDAVVAAIARLQPQYAVLRDSSLTDDATATNFEQLFRTYAPNTTCRVL